VPDLASYLKAARKDRRSRDPRGITVRFLLKLLDRVPASWIRAASAMRGRFPIVKRATDWLPNLLRNREGRIQKGLGRGLRFNGGESAVGFILGTHDTDVQFALSRLLRPGMVCYDVGANVGFTAVLAARCVGDAGRVVCFEPLSDNARQIRVNADRNGFSQIQVHQVALGGADGEAEFRLSHAPTWGRLADAGATPEQSGTTRVPVRRLDSLAASESLPPPQFIKMDVEGAEADVLAGGRAMLAAARPVMVIELHHTYQAVVDALAGLDYEVRPLVPGGQVANTDGEFQILAYPTGHPEAAAFWAALAAGEKMVFA
jgi:FkbM family methyltransferase